MGEVLFVIDDAPGHRPDRLDRITDELRGDLEELRGISVRTVTAPAADGTKSGVVEQLGQLAISGGALTPVAWAIHGIVVTLIERSGARSITVKKGDTEVTITGASAEQMDRLLDLLGDE
ncbi:effector-associated constant component EACC1 [Nocardia cyriacigeorgica]|uniref:effector-associated constant component EACC1 n=1 Tax=Nocardia cyriacigeorgica TaxID=135487 RepID=UPI002456517B|nr:hypothetical protein [Nocardia cyriacigeorgica]